MIEFTFDAKREEKLKKELAAMLGPGVDDVFTSRKALFADGEFTEVFLIDEKILKVISSMKTNPYSAGLFIAKVAGKEVTPSLQLLHQLKPSKTVVVSPKAEQEFLYGKHVVSREVVWSSPLLGKEMVVVCNEADEKLGYGVALTNSDIMRKLGGEVVVRNICDLGWYLRLGD